MRRWILIAALAVSAGWLSTCETTAPLLPADDGPRSHVLHVVSNGWHTAIVIPRPAIAATGLLPEAADFPDAAFLEFGWGDRTYYPAKKKTLGMALGAALTATPAVMHMAGLAVPPRQAGGGAEVLRVTLSETGFRRLVRASPISSNGPPAAAPHRSPAVSTRTATSTTPTAPSICSTPAIPGRRACCAPAG